MTYRAIDLAIARTAMNISNMTTNPLVSSNVRNITVSEIRLIMIKIVEEVISKTEEVMGTESEMRQAILNGMDPEQAYLKFRKF